jgi:hypothetical protein
MVEVQAIRKRQIIVDVLPTVTFIFVMAVHRNLHDDLITCKAANRWVLRMLIHGQENTHFSQAMDDINCPKKACSSTTIIYTHTMNYHGIF